ncbi:MAG: hypothetical protein AAF203_04585, partial [Pseudomonadota bacterium]
MFRFILFLSLTLGVSFSSFGDPAEDKTSRELTLFYVHGLGSGPDAFGDMPGILQSYFADQGHTIRTHMLIYKTSGNNNGTTYDFSQDVAEQVTGYFQTRGMPADSPYSFVVHSQGGIVVLKYLYDRVNACFNSKGELVEKKCDVPYNVQDFVTLGSPLWGSKGANTSQNPIINELLKYSGKYTQLEQLRIGSLSLGNSRRALLRSVKEGEPWKSPWKRPQQVRIHNMVGDFGSYIKRSRGWSLTGSIFGTGSSEIDGIVSAASGNIDFNYVIQKAPGKPLITGETQLGSTYYAGPISHVKFPEIILENHFNGPGVPDALKGIAEVDREDGFAVLQGNDYRHLGMAFVFSVFKNYFEGNEDQPIRRPEYPKNPCTGESGEICDEDGFKKEGLNNFLVDMQIHMPEGFQRRPRAAKKLDATVVVGNEEAQSHSYVRVQADDANKIYKPVIERSGILKDSGINDDKTLSLSKNYFSLYHHGRFSNTASDDCCKWWPVGGEERPKSSLTYDIQFTGFKNQKVQVPVRVGQSSYVQFYLEPFRPLPLKEKNIHAFVWQEVGGLELGDYIIKVFADRHGFDFFVGSSNGEVRRVRHNATSLAALTGVHPDLA